jgi:hypothetical protein
LPRIAPLTHRTEEKQVLVVHIPRPYSMDKEILDFGIFLISLSFGQMVLYPSYEENFTTPYRISGLKSKVKCF